MKRLKILPTNPNRLLMLLLGFWFVLNVFQGIYTELANDEAYYWFITGDLELGYFDHPPLFGLLTWLGVTFFGDTEIGVRLLTIALQPLYLYLFWTIVRHERSTWRSALTYFLVAFSIPQLQLYGWVVTPDAPLLMTTALVLWSYKKYLLNSTSIWWSLLLGVAFASLAYSKYQGALVVLLLVISNLRLLGQWRFWVACGAASLLIIPHLWWQSTHDWVSFRYHLSERNGVFAWGDVFEYLLNLLVTFNPLIFIPFLIQSSQRKATEQMGRALRFLSWGFMGFFLLSTLRGYVQPQWVIPIVFPILYIVTRAGDRYPRYQKFMVNCGVVCALLFIAVRIFAMNYSGGAIRAEIFGNRGAYQSLADTLGGRTLIFDGSYAQASKMNFYSSGNAFAYPSIYSRSSHFQMLSLDDELYGKPVAVVVNGDIEQTTPIDTLNAKYRHFDIDNSIGFFYDTIDFYIPTRRVSVTYGGLPETTLTGRPLVLSIEIYNPYPYDIPLSTFRLIAMFKQGRFTWSQVDIPLKNTKVLLAGERVSFKSEITVPKVDTGRYKFSISLQQPPATSWYNSPRTEIQITNPSQKRGF